MMKKAASVFLAIALVFSAFPIFAEESAETVLYVSQNGNDNATGKKDDPLGSVDGARLRIRELKQEGKGGSFTVYVGDGKYYLSESIVFDAGDSAEDGSLITYKAAEGETVTIVGGAEIAKEEFYIPTEENVVSRIQRKVQGKVLAFDLGAKGITREMVGEVYTPGPYTNRNRLVSANPLSASLFCDGDIMTVSRWPNGTEMANVESVVTMGGATNSVRCAALSDEALKQGFTINYSDVNIDRWITADDAMLYCQGYYDWGGLSTPLGKVDARRRTLSSKYAVEYGIRAYGSGEGGQYYAFNLLEELDSPGEYYIDRNNMILYFYPPQEMNNETEIYMSLMRGSHMKFTGARNIRVENLNFEIMRNSFITVENCENICFDGCSFDTGTGRAVVIKDGKKCGVVNCEVANVNSGIEVSVSRENNEYLESQGHYIINNHIHDWGKVDPLYNAAVAMTGTGCIVAKNKIHDASHLAVSTYGINCMFEYNEIYETNKTVADSGVFYGQGNTALRGNVYRYNYIHDCGDDKGDFVVGIYQDDVFSGSDIYGNIIKNLNTGVRLNATEYVNVYNNIFIDCGTDVSAGHNRSDSYLTNMTTGIYASAAKNTMFDNTIWRSVFPKLYDYDFSLEYVSYSHGNHMYDNISVNSGMSAFTDYAAKYSVMEPSVKYGIGQLKFNDAKNGGYGISEDSVIKTKYNSFKYDFDNVGYTEEGLSKEEIDAIRQDIITIPEELLSYVDGIKLENAKKEAVFISVDSPVFFQNGKYVVINQDRYTVPYLENDTLMLPIELVKTALKMEISVSDGGITVKKDGIETVIGDYTERNGGYYVPARRTLNMLSYDIIWDNSGRAVIVSIPYREEFSEADSAKYFSMEE